MPRRSFNPDDALGGLFDPPASGTDPPEPAPAPAPLTPTALNTSVKTLLERHLTGPVEVMGELSNLRRQGHWYFALKDETSVVSCVMWRSDAARVDLDPRDGDQVIATGRVSHWVPGGRTQLAAGRIEATGYQPVA